MFEKKKITICYSLTSCNSCGHISKREFSDDDYVFKNDGKCSKCDGVVMISKIFGETIHN